MPNEFERHIAMEPDESGQASQMLSQAKDQFGEVAQGARDTMRDNPGLGAIDRGFWTIIVTDAIYNSADQTHDALMEIYRSRFSEQVEIAEMSEVLAGWR
jgi:hypothetical protein